MVMHRRALRAGAVALLLLAAAPSLHAQAPYSLEQVMSYAFPTSLVVAPDGQRMAWLANQRGQRNVWLAEAPRWEPRRLTTYDDDGGVELSALQWLADSRRLLFIRGHGTNMDGEVANPTSEIDGASRDLFLLDTRGGVPRRIADGVNVQVAPTGARIAWVRNRAAMLLDLDASENEAQPVQLFSVRSSLSDLQWSPDGSRIAFSSARDGRAILGTFDTRTSVLTWLTNTVDRDAMPRWSRDGRHIAFIRTVAGSAGYSVWR
ncbi:MAG TPA: hypothetical protein VK928_08860, partial [Longimicrobiales bacterium]|nr:hypothetical protein [Longimicrobiales bacterium]